MKKKNNYIIILRFNFEHNRVRYSENIEILVSYSKNGWITVNCSIPAMFALHGYFDEYSIPVRHNEVSLDL